MKAVVLIVLAAGLYAVDEKFSDGRHTTVALNSFKDTVRVVNRHSDDLLKLIKEQ